MSALLVVNFLIRSVGFTLLVTLALAASSAGGLLSPTAPSVAARAVGADIDWP
ncbi:hypothetical protein ACNTMW_24480 [Planosporangium sp. 12N6]|uniref:hypothetical protein n=1 Tax=Planosporangium spinosum TaxID=3402278 RepID=UPI003CF1F261